MKDGTNNMNTAITPRRVSIGLIKPDKRYWVAYIGEIKAIHSASKGITSKDTRILGSKKNNARKVYFTNKSIKSLLMNIKG
jgi:hypothetical protein